MTANEMLTIIFSSFETPIEDTAHIESWTELFKEALILFAQVGMVALTAYEVKDFFLDIDNKDPLDGMVFNFVIMYQPRLIWRMKRIMLFFSSLFNNRLSKALNKA